MKLKVSNVFDRTVNAKDYAIIVHQGGSRSSKTFSIIQYLIVQALNEPGIKITIARSALTNLKDTAYKDFLEILTISGVAPLFKANLTNLTYTTNTGSEIQFLGLDDPLKLHGRKQDYFWFNEANYCTLADFKQAILRTSKQIILDFNPSDKFHWIYDYVLTREDCILIKSTYRDNPFLDKKLVKEIELLQQTDPDGWLVYGLGERASSKELIYQKYEYYHEEPQGCAIKYGLDFGYNDPCALVKCSYRDGELYWREVIYERGLTTTDLIATFKELNISKTVEIHADSSRPEIIKELRVAGYNIHEAKKFIKNGIDKVKSSKLFVHSQSSNLAKEIQGYKWKIHKGTGQMIDEPIDSNNHALDAARYGSYELVKTTPIKSAIPTLVRAR